MAKNKQTARMTAEPSRRLEYRQKRKENEVKDDENEHVYNEEFHAFISTAPRCLIEGELLTILSVYDLVSLSRLTKGFNNEMKKTRVNGATVQSYMERVYQVKKRFLDHSLLARKTTLGIVPSSTRFTILGGIPMGMQKGDFQNEWPSIESNHQAFSVRLLTEVLPGLEKRYMVKEATMIIERFKKIHDKKTADSTLCSVAGEIKKTWMLELLIKECTNIKRLAKRVVEGGDITLIRRIMKERKDYTWFDVIDDIRFEVHEPKWDALLSATKFLNEDLDNYIHGRNSMIANSSKDGRYSVNIAMIIANASKAAFIKGKNEVLEELSKTTKLMVSSDLTNVNPFHEVICSLRYYADEEAKTHLMKTVYQMMIRDQHEGVEEYLVKRILDSCKIAATVYFEHLKKTKRMDEVEAIAREVCCKQIYKLDNCNEMGKMKEIMKFLLRILHYPTDILVPIIAKRNISEAIEDIIEAIAFNSERFDFKSKVVQAYPFDCAFSRKMIEETMEVYDRVNADKPTLESLPIETILGGIIPNISCPDVLNLMRSCKKMDELANYGLALSSRIEAVRSMYGDMDAGIIIEPENTYLLTTEDYKFLSKRFPSSFYRSELLKIAAGHGNVEACDMLAEQGGSVFGALQGLCSNGLFSTATRLIKDNWNTTQELQLNYNYLAEHMIISAYRTEINVDYVEFVTEMFFRAYTLHNGIHGLMCKHINVCPCYVRLLNIILESVIFSGNINNYNYAMDRYFKGRELDKKQLNTCIMCFLMCKNGDIVKDILRRYQSIGKCDEGKMISLIRSAHDYTRECAKAMLDYSKELFSEAGKREVAVIILGATQDEEIGQSILKDYPEEKFAIDFLASRINGGGVGVKRQLMARIQNPVAKFVVCALSIDRVLLYKSAMELANMDEDTFAEHAKQIGGVPVFIKNNASDVLKMLTGYEIGAKIGLNIPGSSFIDIMGTIKSEVMLAYSQARKDDTMTKRRKLNQ
jgi:hypothetical protein